jgi:hypothetical protein
VRRDIDLAGGFEQSESQPQNERAQDVSCGVDKLAAELWKEIRTDVIVRL